MGAHALQSVLEPKQMASFETAVRFQMFHAIVLLVFGGMLERTSSRWLVWTAYMIFLGTLLFSGSIYLLVGWKLPIGLVTPLGGVLLIIGWGMLVRWSLIKNSLS
ncbi:UNVERIFIED_CONTAM: hypothetical protein GTU68_029385 [Idotea baltica]|nr:hypothetical protein [Idotea baltica]